MSQVRKLTYKQKLFAQKYVENGGNGKQTALQVYGTEDPHTAEVIASENLSKPEISNAIEQIAKDQGITQSTILQKFNQIGSKDTDKWSGDAILKANIELAKILRMYPGSKHTNLNVSIKGDLAKMKYQDAKQALNKLRENNNILLEDIETPQQDIPSLE